MYDVMISGYYGFKNSGDDAILMAITNHLRIYKKDIKIIVLSMNPMETKRVYQVDAINRFNMFQVINAMRKTKVFINGGGSLIQDITSTRSLMYYLFTIKLAKMMGLKVMVYANGIGPINREKNRRIAHKILNNVDYITLREGASLKELQALNINQPKIKVTADPASALEPVTDAEIENIFKAEKIDTVHKMVGFSIREWAEYEKYMAIIAQVADDMIEKYDVQPVFIPMHHPKDISIAEKIVSRMKGKGIIIRNKYDVPQKIGIIKRMEMMIGMRLHALIFAASVGVPVIGLVYEPKVEGFLQSVNQVSAGHVKNLEYEHLKNIVDSVWKERHYIRTELEQTMKPLKDKALENAKIAVELVESVKTKN
jgi:polysaccharide pyruvyl transferase CsaB